MMKAWVHMLFYDLCGRRTGKQGGICNACGGRLRDDSPFRGHAVCILSRAELIRVAGSWKLDAEDGIIKGNIGPSNARYQMIEFPFSFRTSLMLVGGIFNHGKNICKCKKGTGHYWLENGITGIAKAGLTLHSGIIVCSGAWLLPHAIERGLALLACRRDLSDGREMAYLDRI